MAKKKEIPTTPEGVDSYRKRFIVASLRRASIFWPYKNKALKAARIERGLYLCNHCKGSFSKKEVQLDHINPVVKLSGFTTWDDYFTRMYCDQTGYQVLCKACHYVKSKEEQVLRKINKKAKKLKK